MGMNHGILDSSIGHRIAYVRYILIFPVSQDYPVPLEDARRKMPSSFIMPPLKPKFPALQPQHRDLVHRQQPHRRWFRLPPHDR